MAGIVDWFQWLLTHREGIPVILLVLSIAVIYILTKRIPEERLFLDSDFKRIGVDFFLLAIAFYLEQKLSGESSMSLGSVMILLVLIVIYFVLLDQYINTRRIILLVGPFNNGLLSNLRSEWGRYIRWIIVQIVGFVALVKVLSLGK